jgi:hypothetical protein
MPFAMGIIKEKLFVESALNNDKAESMIMIKATTK